MNERSKRRYLPSKDEHGKLSDARWAFTTTAIGQVIIHVELFKDEEGNDTDDIRDIKIVFTKPGRTSAPVVLTLTAGTVDELQSLQHIIQSAFDWALPVARQRDKEAQDAYNSGDDSFDRIYRQLPTLVYRKRPQSEHDKGVHDGPEDAPAALGDGVDSEGDVRAPESEVAERDSP